MALVGEAVVVVASKLLTVVLGFARSTTGVLIWTMGLPRAPVAEGASKRQKTSLICF